MKKIICLLLLCVLLFSLIGCNDESDKASESEETVASIDEETLYSSLSKVGDTAYFDGSYTTASITDEASAVSSLDGISTLFGIANPKDELIPEACYSVNGSWYRLNQYYQGIPVYGRYITVMADKDGNSVGLMANTQELTGCEYLPAMTEAEVRDKLKDSYPLPEGDALLTYYTYDGSPQLCYRFDDDLNSLFISADDGTVIHETPILDYENVAYTFGENDKNTIYIDLTDSVYTLHDNQRNINVSSVIEEEIDGEMAFLGNGNDITWDKKDTWEEESGNILAMKVMQWLEEVYDYFANPDTYDFIPMYNGEACNINGFVHVKKALTGSGDKKGVYDYEENAFYGGENADFGVAVGEKSTTFQTVYHEYTHGVVKRLAGFSTGEAQAINEAYADVFSELIEASTSESGECDWECRDRLFSNPPAKPADRESHYLDNYANYEAGIDPHYGGTIISHAAYLMNTNGVGYDKLGLLWYRTLALCSAGTDMHSFSYIMNAVAGQMRDSGELTEDNQKAVEEAFIAVGLIEKPVEFFTSVHESPNVIIYNKNGNLACNVMLEIDGMTISEESMKASGVTTGQELVRQEEVQTDLKAGAYKLTVTGRNSSDRVVNYVVVREDGSDDIEIQVPFKTKMTGTIYDEMAGTPLAAASATLLSADGQNMYTVTTTNNLGEWVLYMPDDNYHAVWACDGYISNEGDIAASDFPPRDEACFELGRIHLTPKLPTYLSSCIGEYGGVTYCTYDVPNSDFVALPVSAAEYDYISSFLFYGGKLYYCCKDAGTSDYRSALYRCNPDGSETEKLFGDGDLDYTTSFHIYAGILYPHGSGRYYDIAAENLVESEEYISDFGALPDWYSRACVFTQQYKKNTISMAKYDFDSPYERSDWQNIVKLDNSWSRICGLTSKAMYYQSDKGNTASLYRYDFETGSVTLVDSKQTAGSGGYFNW